MAELGQPPNGHSQDSIFIASEEYLDEEEYQEILARKRKEREREQKRVFQEEHRVRLALVKDLERQLRVLEQIEKDEQEEIRLAKMFKISVDLIPDLYYRIIVGLVGIYLIIYLVGIVMSITEWGIGTAEAEGGIDEGPLAEGGGDDDGGDGRRLQDLRLNFHSNYLKNLTDNGFVGNMRLSSLTDYATE